NAFVHNNYDVDIKVTICKITLDKVKITIEDNGIGINENDLKHIFKRYFRGTKTSQVTEGSGLGMAIANDIIQVHNGNIIVESKENLGTKIIILI
ncbi:MAG: ATP-binding protein, partial [Clostridium sp.]